MRARSRPGSTSVRSVRRLSLLVDIDRFDVDKYLPSRQKSAQAKPSPAQPKRPEQPIDLSPLKALNLEGRLYYQ